MGKLENIKIELKDLSEGMNLKAGKNLIRDYRHKVQGITEIKQHKGIKAVTYNYEEKTTTTTFLKSYVLGIVAGIKGIDKNGITELINFCSENGLNIALNFWVNLTIKNNMDLLV